MRDHLERPTPHYVNEVNKRRTFAIISHPDAGKTTITEKILYEGGVIREVGEVKGKSGTRAATSDWMALEQQRGVSITSSALKLDFEGLRINLLDTPGHKDFGEDTYRTLIAADSAAMLIDAAKGVEVQTRKLYEVCCLRKIPIFTFANKMDREGKEPLELIDDVENTLGIRCYPVTWPMGMGHHFCGLYHREKKCIYLYTLGSRQPQVKSVVGWEDKQIIEWVGEEIFWKLQEDLELLEGALEPFSTEEFLAGEVSPMTFGSAKYSWGVDLFLQLFARLSPPPGPRHVTTGQVEPTDKKFSGFIFKIQANMDKRHRDRIAFVRVCSGKFVRGMKVKHIRLGRELRLAYASQLMAQERETVDEAFAGDIVGIVDTGHFQIGDTITEGKEFEFDKIPRFSPEIFSRLSVKDPLKRKQLQKGVQQLSEEGMIQKFFDPEVGAQDPVLGVVGELQLDVLMFRLNDEYKLDVCLERLPHSVARWPRKNGEPTHQIQGSSRIFYDDNKEPVLLLEKEWDLRWLEKQNPDVCFHISGRG